MAPSKKHHDLLSKSEIATALGMTSQTFSNRQARDSKFPQPTYSNRSGSVALYTPEDAKKVYEYCTRAERERLLKASQMFASLTGEEVESEFEDVELPLDDEDAADKPEAKPAAAAAEAKPAEDKAAADKAAADKAAKQAATAAKIKAADEKIKADKDAKAAAAATTSTTAKVDVPADGSAQASRMTPAQVAADKADARRISKVDNNTGIDKAPAAPAKAPSVAPKAAAGGNGAAFIR